MILKSIYIPPSNSQRIDPEWAFNGVKIGPNSQCQGNCNQDLVISLAMEFGIKELMHIDTYTYYAMFSAFLHSAQDEVQRQDMMNWRNHLAFLQKLFCDYRVNIIGEEIPNNISYLRQILLNTKRPVSVGTLLSRYGHWIRVHGFDDDRRVFYVNDPYGTHPYLTGHDKNTLATEYTYEKLQNHTIRRIIYIEDKRRSGNGKS